MDWAPFFSAAYYEKRIPVWGALDPALGAAEPPGGSWWRVAITGLLAGMLVEYYPSNVDGEKRNTEQPAGGSHL